MPGNTPRKNLLGKARKKKPVEIRKLSGEPLESLVEHKKDSKQNVCIPRGTETKAKSYEAPSTGPPNPSKDGCRTKPSRLATRSSQKNTAETISGNQERGENILSTNQDRKAEIQPLDQSTWPQACGEEYSKPSGRHGAVAAKVPRGAGEGEAPEAQEKNPIAKLMQAPLDWFRKAKEAGQKDSPPSTEDEAGPKTETPSEDGFGSGFMDTISTKLSSLPMLKLTQNNVVTRVGRDLEKKEGK